VLDHRLDPGVALDRATGDGRRVAPVAAPVQHADGDRRIAEQTHAIAIETRPGRELRGRGGNADQPLEESEPRAGHEDLAVREAGDHVEDGTGAVAGDRACDCAARRCGAGAPA
jgi:hypothetical protein